VLWAQHRDQDASSYPIASLSRIRAPADASDLSHYDWLRTMSGYTEPGHARDVGAQPSQALALGTGGKVKEQLVAST
jgi:hypothetical protein